MANPNSNPSSDPGLYHQGIKIFGTISKCVKICDHIKICQTLPPNILIALWVGLGLELGLGLGLGIGLGLGLVCILKLV